MEAPRTVGVRDQRPPRRVTSEAVAGEVSLWQSLVEHLLRSSATRRASRASGQTALARGNGVRLPAASHRCDSVLDRCRKRSSRAGIPAPIRRAMERAACTSTRRSMPVALVRAIHNRRFDRYATCEIYGVVPAGVAARQARTASRSVQSDVVDRRDADAAVAASWRSQSHTPIRIDIPQPD
jgi:hypothetical protein